MRLRYQLTLRIASPRSDRVPEPIGEFIKFTLTSAVSDLRLAISLGGDSDTLACIAGGIAHAFYGEVPAEIATRVRGLLTQDLLAVVDNFTWEYCR